MRLTLSRIVAWVMVPVFIAGVGSMIWLNDRLGLPTSYQDLMLILGFGAFAVVGSLLVAKLPGNPVSWIMVTIGLMTGLFPAAETYAAYVMTTQGKPDALAVRGRGSMAGTGCRCWFWPWSISRFSSPMDTSPHAGCFLSRSFPALQRLAS